MTGKYYLYAILAMSGLLFIMMGIDKQRARCQRRRVPEKTLFTLAALGGAVGGWLGMYVFRHKTKHWYFVAGFSLLAIAQVAIYFVLR